MTDAAYEGGFDHLAGFVPGEIAGALGLGPLEQQYEELFAEVLADGIITADERARLEKAADNLGLDRGSLAPPGEGDDGCLRDAPQGAHRRALRGAGGLPRSHPSRSGG